MRLPGDEPTHRPTLGTSGAVWIEQSTATVWPWLSQMGQGRGGLHGYEFVDNSFVSHHHNAERIHPEWQHLATGDHILMTPAGWLGLHEGLALSVANVIEVRAIMVRGAPPSLPREAVLSVATEPITALMTRGVLRSIRRRGQGVPKRVPQPVTPQPLSN